MKQINAIISGSKLWNLIKDIMATINAGKRPAQDIFRKNDISTNFQAPYFDMVARANSIR